MFVLQVDKNIHPTARIEYYKKIHLTTAFTLLKLKDDAWHNLKRDTQSEK